MIRYFELGAAALFDGCAGLSQNLQLEVDGVEIKIPPSVEGLICTNLPSWAGGTNLWDPPEEVFLSSLLLVHDPELGHFSYCYRASSHFRTATRPLKLSGSKGQRILYVRLKRAHVRRSAQMVHRE